MNLPSQIMIASYPSHMDVQNAVATLKDIMYNGRHAIGFFMRTGLPALKEELGEDAAMLYKYTANRL
ncbi:hypothetical protein M378DRAFT_170866 [Amanita muscaria Koide BX008]|uniref:Uncharacterized protein n=1 Tax=Amanita muscaria (strain Koide BX008) TaxID=946122 RepID=A0A0C2WNE8_AMAMK|nr:hypothetical protein M378DRAFT_170866 [Amanita muscaria Koide BX008]